MGSNTYISVVTSCFNCKDYIERTIQSVVWQKYPDLEYIVVDGASTDGTLEVIERYAEQIDVTISEPDAGQYCGIQKGLDLAHGEVVAWLNGDDVYYPWTFSVVDAIFRKYPDVEWIIGLPTYMNEAGQCIKISGTAGTAFPGKFIRNGWFRADLAGYLQQESMFWRKSLLDKAGGLNLNLKFAADFELWTRFAEHAEAVAVAVPLAIFRQRPGKQKSSLRSREYEGEVLDVCRKFNRPSVMWESIAKRGLVWKMLCRLVIWRKCQVIAYSLVEQDWVIKKIFRPLSRASIAELLLEFQMPRR